MASALSHSRFPCPDSDKQGEDVPAADFSIDSTEIDHFKSVHTNFLLLMFPTCLLHLLHKKINIFLKLPTLTLITLGDVIYGNIVKM